MNQSEDHNLITNILPRLINMGWHEKGYQYKVTCSVGQIDVLYKYNSRKLVVIEVKKSGKGKKTALKQGIAYAKAVKAPIVLATDGTTFLQTWHIKKEEALSDQYGIELDYSKFNLLNHVNLLRFIKNPSLKQRIKSQEELRKIFNSLNNLGKDAGLTVGLERMQEIAKILFIKMLSDNEIHLNSNDWDNMNNSSADNIMEMINFLLKRVADKGFGTEQLVIDKSKSDIVANIVTQLNEIDFNHRYYDSNSTLFQSFLSERARGGTSNDLGQYFTPRCLIELIYSLSDYKKDKRVYDPYCGTGGVLCEFFIKQDLADEEKSKFAKNFLFGSEISKEVTNLARMSMVIAGDGHGNINSIDSLLKTNPHIDKEFDIVATNMPFDPKVPDNGVPNNYFSLAHDGTDIAKFIEHCIKRCAVRGKIILIVGKGFLTEKKSTAFRKRLLREYNVEAIYDLYSGAFAPYTPVFSCLLVINKKSPPLQARQIDYFPIKDSKSIQVAIANHSDSKRYEKGYYKVPISEILASEECDLRGRIYEPRRKKRTQCRIKDLVDYLEVPEYVGKIPPNTQKMTTPNAIEDGIYMIQTKSNKQVSEGFGSFKFPIQKNAIIVARITNKRVAHCQRYLGSAMICGNAHGLVTSEYYQLLPENSTHLYYILYHMRNKKFQEIAEWAKGTGGQQRVDIKFILDEVIPKPTKQGMIKAKESLMNIQKLLEKIETLQKNKKEICKEIYTN